VKALKLNGLKPELVDIDYNILKAEMEECKRKNKMDGVASYSKLLSVLDENSDEDFIDKRVNEILATDRKKIKEMQEQIKDLKNNIKMYEKEIRLLSKFSEDEMNNDDIPVMLAMINTL
jgi:hypothetical protein